MSTFIEVTNMNSVRIEVKAVHNELCEVKFVLKPEERKELAVFPKTVITIKEV